MIKPNFHRKEGPVAAVVGSVVGGMLGGGGVASIVGSVVGGMIGSSLLGSRPSYPQQGMPATPAATAMPGSTAAPGSDLNNPAAGSATAATQANVDRGSMAAARRGRLATILSNQQLAGEDTERLGG